jgi:asparagine synthase (glutamine-hydrolysing)
MSGICGWVGEAAPEVLQAMLAAIDYRGDRTEVALAPGAALGYRWWSGRPGKSPGIHRAGAHLVACAGTLAPPVASPAAALLERLTRGASGLDDLDGAFAGAWWDGERRVLTLIRDPFGVRSLYYTEHGGVFYFASELKQLLAIPHPAGSGKSGDAP